MTMQYPGSYARCEELWKTARTPKKGKALGNKWYRLLKEGDDFCVYYGGWRLGGPPAPLDPQAKIMTFSPDGTITSNVVISYENREQAQISNMFRQMEKGTSFFYPGFRKNYATPGWWLKDAPLFTGFKYQKYKIITTSVAHLEEEMVKVTKETQAKARALIKPLRVYDKFKAFDEELNSIHHANWQERIERISKISFEDINPDDADSLIKFIAARKNFGLQLQTHLGYIGSWRAKTISVDYQKIIPILLRYGAFQHIAETRLKLYEEWYNKNP